MVKDPSNNSNLPPNAVKIGEASKILGLHIDTLRRWEKSGKITPVRTPGGTRLYSLSELSHLIPQVSDNSSRPSRKTKPLPKNLHKIQRIDEEGVYVHVYNKGIDKKTIFNDEEDYQTFQSFLKDYLTAPQDPNSIKKSFTVHGRIFKGTPHQPKNYLNQVELIAYNLMSDHFHLLLQQKTRGSIESFIRSLCTRYSIYFNKKYKRTGALFEGPYKSAIVRVDDLPLLTRFFYFASDGYSSYPEYLDIRGASWIKSDIILNSFEDKNAFKEYVEKYQSEPLLDNLLLETESEHLANTEPKFSNVNLKPRSRMPEFLLTSTIFFALLVTFSIRNIWISEFKSFQYPSTTNPTVLSATKEVSKAPNAVSKAPAESVKPETTITVVAEESSTINVRQEATTSSKIIYEARNGETFGFISHELDWVQIKLASGSAGFISAKYIEEGAGK